jgi:hypothetical protein
MVLKVTKEMIGAAHDIMLARGDFVLSANLIEAIYLAMRAKEPMVDREQCVRDALRYRKLRSCERFAIDEKCTDGHWEPISHEQLDETLDKEIENEH